MGKYTPMHSHLVHSPCMDTTLVYGTLGLVWATKIFRAYLLGHWYVAFTDHATYTSLLNLPHRSSKPAHWAMAIQELDLEIHHYSGKSNVVADTLSHNPVPVADAFKIVAHSLSPDLPTLYM